MMYPLLRVRPSTLAEFGFRRKGKAGWEYAAPVGNTSLEYRVTVLLTRIAGACFERDVFTLKQSRELLEPIREKWREELEFLWEDSPECVILRRADTGKWYAVMMRIPGQKFGLPEDAVSEFILLRVPRGEEDAIRADCRFLPAYHMNKRTWFAIQLDCGVEFPELLLLAERSRTQAVKK